MVNPNVLIMRAREAGVDEVDLQNAQGVGAIKPVEAASSDASGEPAAGADTEGDGMCA
jgi:hypothetical protein